MTADSPSRAGRVAAYALSGTGLVLAVAAVIMHLARRSWSLAPPSAVVEISDLAAMVGNLGFLCAGAIVVAKRRRHVLGWTMLAGGLLSIVAEFAFEYMRFGLRFDRFGSPYDEVLHLPGRVSAAWLASWLELVAIGALLVFVPWLFPTGAPASRRWRFVPWYAAAAVLAAAVRVALAPGPVRGLRTLDPQTNPLGVEAARWLQYRASLFGRDPSAPGNTFEVTMLAVVAAVLVAVAAVTGRYRRTRQEERAPIRWFAVGAFTVGVGYAGVVADFVAGVESPVTGRAVGGIVALGYLVMACATLAALFRHRLFELDVVVRRAAAFGGLTAFITAVYAATALSAGAVARPTGGTGWLVSVFGTTVAAAGLEPVRQRAERLATRLVFGERLAPYELSAQLWRRLAEVPPLEGPAALAREVGSGLGARAVRVRLGADGSVAGEWMEDAAPEVADGGECAAITIEFRGEIVGLLEWTRHAGDTVTPADRRLVAALGAQAAPALHSAKVMAELARRAHEAADRSVTVDQSRRRLAVAQLDAQERFQSELHEVLAKGLQELPSLLRGVPESGEPAAELDRARTVTEEALWALRRLGRGLRPSLLEDRGVVVALEALAEDLPARLEVAGDRLTGRFDPAAESAVFFSCAELVRALAPDDRPVVRVERDPGAVVCTVDVPDVQPATRQLVEDRVESAGGTLTFERVSRGHRVVARLPA